MGQRDDFVRALRRHWRERPALFFAAPVAAVLLLSLPFWGRMYERRVEHAAARFHAYLDAGQFEMIRHAVARGRVKEPEKFSAYLRDVRGRLGDIREVRKGSWPLPSNVGKDPWVFSHYEVVGAKDECREFFVWDVSGGAPRLIFYRASFDKENKLIPYEHPQWLSN